MNTNYVLITIFLMGIITFLFRILPFYCMEFLKQYNIVFHLGKTLPACVMVILVMFSLKDINYAANPHGMPEFISLLITIVVHAIKRNVFLSMVLGTCGYIFLTDYM